MYTTTRQNYENQNEEIENHAHDLIHELSLRLNCLRRYDQYIANASGQPEIQEFWRESKCRLQLSLDQLNELIRNHVNFHMFS